MDDSKPFISPEQLEVFERYLMGAMEPAQRSAFEQRLQAEPELARSYAEFKGLFGAVEEAALREKLKAFQAETDRRSRGARPARTLLKIAASVAVLLSVGWWFFTRQTPGEELFDAYYAPDPGLPTVMGSSSNYAFYEAMVSYKQGHYEAAISQWEKLQESKGANDTLDYFLGSAFLARGDAAGAIPFFDRVLLTGQSPFRNDAAYFKGLAHLSIGDTPAALKSLEMGQDERCRELAAKLK